MNAPYQLPPIVDRFRRLPPRIREQILADIEGDEELGSGALYDLHHDWEGFWLRQHQIVSDDELFPWDAAPPGLVVITGPRADGKSQSAFTLWDRLVRSGRAELPRLFAATDADIESTLIKGKSGIMSLYDRNDPARPRWRKNAGYCGELEYPGGLVAKCFTAAASQQCVGDNGDLDLYDDVAKWGPNARTAWGHARLSCRLGIALGIVATTRRGTHMLQRLLKKKLEGVLVKRGTDLRANRFNLSPKYYTQVATELGENDDLIRQELYDEDVTSSSPFAGLDFDSTPIRIIEAPREAFAEVIVAVDPAEHNGTSHDEWGIGAAGRRDDKHLVALEDVSDVLGEEEAGDRIIELCEQWGATKVIVETNRSKAVTSTIRAAYYKRKVEALEVGDSPPVMPEIIPVHAKERKVIRAGPVRPLYLQGMIHHLPGMYKLEKQAREWDPNAPRRPRQDDRIDWLVHALTYLGGLVGKQRIGLEHVRGLGERSRQISRRQEASREGADMLIRSDTVPAGDPRSSYKRRGGHSLRRKKVRL